MDLASFSLLLGHLVGDYLLQWDYLASNKANPHPGPNPHPTLKGPTYSFTLLPEQTRIALCQQRDWQERQQKWRLGHVCCTLHCALYTLAMVVFNNHWLRMGQGYNWLAYVAIFLAHWPVDRFGLARKWMLGFSGQKGFATGPCAPWSVIVVDNTWHLLVLWLIAMIWG